MFDPEKAHKYSETSSLIRGIILSQTVRLEFWISLILIEIFCKENLKNDFHKYFMSDSLTFDQKKSIFCSIRKKVNLKESYKEIGSDLQYIQDLRNLVAHADDYINPKLVNALNGNEISLISFTKKYGERIIKINLEKETKEDIDKNVYSINSFTDKIVKFMEFAKINTPDFVKP